MIPTTKSGIALDSDNDYPERSEKTLYNYVYEMSFIHHNMLGLFMKKEINNDSFLRVGFLH